ncbi:MAG: hypothetical protein Q7I99_09510 [Acholeplasmataceae bacterium]|nr:hypothetical protein [Acholeplasmataceae bacterium]
MENYQFNTPVVLFFFIREESTMKVLDQIRIAKPKKLYLVGEGHRPNKPGEKERVETLRQLVESRIDWDCEVFKNYVTEDIGAGRRISSGISWVFETENRAIFLEDDIIASQSFFRYCQEMLDYYEHDNRVMAISGSNPVPKFEFDGDYTFSNVAHIWGWATWKRAWENYDFEMKEWPYYKKNELLKASFRNKVFYEFRCDEFDLAYEGISTTWDYQFSFHLLKNSGLAVVPKINMISNVGIGPNATNTKSKKEYIFGTINEIEFPIQFKDEVFYDDAFDNYYFKKFLFKSYYSNPWFRFKYRLKKILPKRFVISLKKFLGRK